MPLFFLVSGFLSKKKRSLADWMKKKTRTLLVPYFVSCAGIVIASIFFESLVTLLKDNNAVFILNIQKWVRAAFIGLGYHAELWQTSLPAIGPIWFLLALFWALLLLELYKRTKYPMACAIGVSFLSLALHHFFWLPWSIQEGMVASLFATVGYSISLEKVKQNRILVCCVAILYLLFCLFSGSHLDMVKCAFPYGPVDFVGAVCCVIAILMVSIRLQNHLMSRLLPVIGRNSIWILCIHTIEFDVFPWWIWEVGQDGSKTLTTECFENIVLMFPFTLLLMWTMKEKMVKKICFWNIVKKSTQVAFIFSLTIELLQLFLRLGTFQFSDIFYNALGGCLGGIVYWIGLKIFRQ